MVEPVKQIVYMGSRARTREKSVGEVVAVCIPDTRRSGINDGVFRNSHLRRSGKIQFLGEKIQTMRLLRRFDIDNDGWLSTL